MTTSPHRSSDLAAVARVEALRAAAAPCTECDRRGARTGAVPRFAPAWLQTLAYAFAVVPILFFLLFFLFCLYGAVPFSN